jgi:hypothetical protein
MNNGLMDTEEWSNLGFGDESASSATSGAMGGDGSKIDK